MYLYFVFLVFGFDWVFPDGYSRQLMGGCPSFVGE